MNSLDSKLKVVLLGCPSLGVQSLFPDHVDLQSISSARAVKKQLRAASPAMLMLMVADEASNNQAEQLCRYVREGLADPLMKIVLLGEAGYALDEVVWLEQHGASCCLSVNEARRSINRSVIRRELESFTWLQLERHQREVETQLLMSITRFSRVNESVNSLIVPFSHALSEFCSACLCLQVKPGGDGQAQVAVVYPEADESPDTALVTPLQGLIDLSIKQKSPQVQLLPQELDIQRIEQHVGAVVGGYLAFPLLVYDNVVRVLICLIPAAAMDRVSMHQVEVMSKAAEQLQVLLERRSAENQLKNQYVRLKRTMLELNATRDQLQHTEKMASIGQLAAGIAHEINNPLAYVMSNFRPLNEYVDTMMRMLELHGEFMQAMDMEADERTEHLRKTITEFEQASDLTYIYDDIRALVNESRDGLMRVKDIISDLNSFSRKDVLETADFNVAEVIDQTLRILKYELGNNTEVVVELDAELVIEGHRGFVQQVLTNLIKNAAQAMQQAQTPEPRLLVSIALQGALVDIRVRDNGPGISAAAQQRIFEPFYTTKEVGKGTGLGLSVTYNLVQKMGGTLALQSEEGCFTEFVLQLPLRLAVAQPQLA